MRGQSIVEYALILVLVAVIVIIVISILGGAIRSQTQASSVFPQDTVATVDRCMDTTTSTTYKSVTVSTNADGMIHCLYNAGYSLALHGDPIIAPTPQQAP